MRKCIFIGDEFTPNSGYFGMLRSMDDLGRIVIPKEWRDFFGWKANHRFKVYAFENGDILLKDTRKRGDSYAR